MRLLIKFGYIGWLYTGYQAGNGKRSIEDTILGVIRKNGLADMLHSAARTDRGVSAVSNAFAIDTDERASKVLGILNSSIDGMIFHTYAEVPDDFNPRHCDYKVYRYTLPENEAGPYIKQALGKFRGRHDFRHFCKMDERNPVRTIRAIRARKRNGMLMVDFKSRSFLWNQIRTIMAYAVDHSVEPLEEDPFERTSRYSRLLEPEPLVLMEMVYRDVLFNPSLGFAKIGQFNSKIRDFSIRNSVMRSFRDVLDSKSK